MAQSGGGSGGEASAARRLAKIGAKGGSLQKKIAAYWRNIGTRPVIGEQSAAAMAQ